MLKYRPLISPDELAKFAQLYFRLSGNQVSPEYLSQTSAKAIVFYKKKRPDDWLGGFVINEGNEGGVMRYLEIFSEDKREEMLCNLGVSENDMVEITCFFLRRKLSKINRIFILCISAFLACMRRKRMVLGASFLPKFSNKLGKIFVEKTIFDDTINNVSGKLKIFYFHRKEIFSIMLRIMLVSY